MLNAKNDLSNTLSVASLVAGLEVNFNLNFNNINKGNLISNLLVTEVDENNLSKKKERKINK